VRIEIKTRIEDHEYKFDVYFDGILHQTETQEGIRKIMNNLITIPTQGFIFKGYNDE